MLRPRDTEPGNHPFHPLAASARHARTGAEQRDGHGDRSRCLADLRKEIGAVDIVGESDARNSRRQRHARAISEQERSLGEQSRIGRITRRHIDAMRVDEVDMQSFATARLAHQEASGGREIHVPESKAEDVTHVGHGRRAHPPSPVL